MSSCVSIPNCVVILMISPVAMQLSYVRVLTAIFYI